MEGALGALHGPRVGKKLTGVPGGLVCVGVGSVGLLACRHKRKLYFSLQSRTVTQISLLRGRNWHTTVSNADRSREGLQVSPMLANRALRLCPGAPAVRPSPLQGLVKLTGLVGCQSYCQSFSVAAPKVKH